MAGAIYKLSTCVVLFLIISLIFASYRRNESKNGVTSVSIASNADKICYPRRNLARWFRTSSPIPCSVQVCRVMRVIKLSLCASYPILLAGDVRINPGPVNNNNSTCAYCMKYLIRNNQPRFTVQRMPTRLSS